MIIGFNTGQMHHYITLQYGDVHQTPKKEIQLIKAVAPKEMLANNRFSGTVSNYQNIHEPAFGSYENTAPLWAQIVSQRGSFMDKLKFLMYAISRNNDAIMSMGKRHVSQSYIFNMMADFAQLGCNTMAFTFNSHMPYLGECDLKDSIASLKHILDQGIKLESIELENETYFTDIIGDNRSYKNKIDNFISYLEYSVVPEIEKVVGKDVPLGLSFCNPKVIQYRYWRESVIALAKRLERKGFHTFIAPHVYTKGYDNQAIIDELNYELAGVTANDIEIRVTEYNAHSSAGNCNQNQALDFIHRFNTICRNKGFKATYYHSLFTKKGTHFSFVK